MLLHNNRISMRIQKQILKNAKHRTKELIKKRNASVSLSQYIRELIEHDTEKKLIN